MNKIYIYGMMTLAAAGLASCEADDSPKLEAPTEFVLNTPPFATQYYELTPGNQMEFTCSQPNYGITVATTYNLEVSLLEDFGAGQPEAQDGEENETPTSVVIAPLSPQSTKLVINDADLAVAICQLRGITSEEEYTDIPAHPLYVRALADVAGQAVTKIASNTVTLPQVKGYCAFQAVVLDVLYIPGNPNGWNHSKCQQILGNGDGKYQGLVYIDGEFKFTNQPDWNGINYGNAGEDGKLDTDGGAGNLNTPAAGAGLYWVEVNTNTLSYTTTKVDLLGVIGDFQGWNTKETGAMTPSEDFMTWSYRGDFVDGGFKFIINPLTTEWTYNYGGTFEKLEFNGPNLPSTAGEHTVTIDISKVPYTATFE